MKSVWVIEGLDDGGPSRIFTSKSAAIDYAVAVAGPVDLNVFTWSTRSYEITSEQAYLEVKRVDLNPNAEWDGYCLGVRLT